MSHRLIFVFLLSIFMIGTASCGVAPRLPSDVARAVNRDTMRVLHSEHVDLYYPDQYKREAEELARRAEGCVQALRGRTDARGGLASRRFQIIFPDLPLNNAFVIPPQNGDFFSIIPTHWTMDALLETGLVPDPGYVACHELTHYVQAQQTFRVLGGLNKAFGYFITPQDGLDAWFWEGLATFYENRLQPGTFRLAWPTWNGMFHAAVAGKHLSGGDLSVLNRKVHWGNHYLYGSHFIAFLVERYGEDRLWRLITKQGQSFFFPFIVNQRFKSVYGKTLSALIDEFGAFLADRYPVRARPDSQRSLRQVGMNGRYARAEDGTEAVIREAMDDPPMLTVYGKSGEIRYERRLTEVLPARKLVSPRTVSISGLRFSRDGKHLYFVAVDLGLVFKEARLLELDLARGRLRVVSAHLEGTGGDISPDGTHYLFVKVSGHGHVLSRYELTTGKVTELFRAPPGVYLSSPIYSPDGAQIVLSAFDRSYQLWLLRAADGQRMRTLSTPDGPLADATFADADHLLFLAPHQERFQVFSYDLSTRRTVRLTDAPYLAVHARAQGGTVRFFNREGVGYTLDEVPLPGSTQTFRPRTLADAQDGGTGIARDVSHAPPQPQTAADHDAGVTMMPDAAVAVTATEAPPGSPDGGVPSTLDAAVAATAMPVEPGSSDGAQAELTIVETPPPPYPPPPSIDTPLKDARYRAFPDVLIPSVRAPAASFSTGSPAGNFLGVYVGGTDVLGRHRWGASFGVQPGTWELSGSVGYLNTQLSPLSLQIDASQLAYDDYRDKEIGGERTRIHDRHQQRDVTFAATLGLRTSALGLSFHITEDKQPDKTEGTPNRRLGGGTLTFQHNALESTQMSGPRRGYSTQLGGSYYPRALGTLDNDVTDLRGALSLVTPLPLSRRHTLWLGLRARGVISGEDAPLLEVGGNQINTLFHQPETREDVVYPGLPPKIRFREVLRGFETYPFMVDQIGIADLTYRYPIIMDRGTATSLSILPSFFLRQIDLELFASAAASSTRRDEGHLAVGGALSVRFQLWAPLVLGYQLSKRFTDDDNLQHLVLFGPEL